MDHARVAPADAEMGVADRLLDAAGELFAARGPRSVTMAQVADAAGVSRATLYRYFADRRELHLAFVHREARRIVARVLVDVARIDEPEARLVALVTASLRQVRGTPLLAGWIQSDSAALTASLVAGSDVIATLGLPVTGDDLAARWLWRVIFALLLVPGSSVEEEREMIARFVAPLIIRANTGTANTNTGSDETP
jgi:AcrR family transcriptional regulator